MDRSPNHVSRRGIGFFQLVMINIIAVASIRNLPFSAAYGFSLLFFYALAAIFFFVPSALVSAELATGWPTTGGIYVWVREALGKRLSLLTIWLSWIYNLFWYPTIMAFIAGIFAYLFDQELVSSKLYMSLTVIGLFWIITLVNCFGMRVSGHFSTIGALVGTILPMLVISLLGIIWIVRGNVAQINFSWAEAVPNQVNMTNLAFLTNVLFGLLGLEMSATHAKEVSDPRRNYPRALLTSASIILSALVLSSLAIAIVVPGKDLSLVTGAMQAFDIFLKAFQLDGFLPLIGACMILGGLSGAGAWIIGPTKGLMVASQDGSLPKTFMKTNKWGVPVNILLLQGLIVSVLCLAFILMPTINSSFWLLSVITGQVALIVYIFLFVSAIVLHYKKPHVPRSFRVPGGKMGMWLVGGIGILSCLVVIGLGFLPPEQVKIDNFVMYESSILGGVIAFCLIPLLIRSKKGARNH